MDRYRNCPLSSLCNEAAHGWSQTIETCSVESEAVATYSASLSTSPQSVVSLPWLCRWMQPACALLRFIRPGQHFLLEIVIMGPVEFCYSKYDSQSLPCPLGLQSYGMLVGSEHNSHGQGSLYPQERLLSSFYCRFAETLLLFSHLAP